MNKRAFKTEEYSIPRAKISDGKSVSVTVPANTEIKTGEFVLLDGWFGFVFSGVKTAAGETARAILNVEQAEYESAQIANVAFKVGDAVYYDAKAKKLTSEAGTGNQKVGKVTIPKNADGAITFILAAQA